MRYLAIGFWTQAGGGDSFTLSRETDTDDKDTVVSMLNAEAHMDAENLDTVLLVESAISSLEAPSVVKHWGAANDDFDADDAWGEPEEVDEEVEPSADTERDV